MIPITQRQALLDTIKNTAHYVKKLSPLKYEFFRGDSFQFVIDKPEQALTIAILLRAALRKSTPEKNSNIWDARISIGIGDIAYVSTDITTSDGEAFQLSRRGLDTLGKKALGIFTRWEDINEELQVSTAFADDIISNWSRYQAETMMASIGDNLKQKEIAIRFQKTPQAINKTLSLAKDNLIKLYIKRFETIILNKIEVS